MSEAVIRGRHLIAQRLDEMSSIDLYGFADESDCGGNRDRTGNGAWIGMGNAALIRGDLFPPFCVVAVQHADWPCARGAAVADRWSRRASFIPRDALRKSPCGGFRDAATADDPPFDENSRDALADHQFTSELCIVSVLAEGERLRAHAMGEPVTQHVVNIGGANRRRSTFDREPQRIADGLPQ